jgi:hypothetical protein
VVCTKGVLVVAEHGHTDGSNWLEAAYGVLMTVFLTSRLLGAAAGGAAASGGGGADGVLEGLRHLLGCSLAALGSVLAGALEAKGADSVPAATPPASEPKRPA